MLLAIKDNQRIKPTPNQRATCTYCDQAVHSKCGKIKRWHWAHVKYTDCESNTKCSDWVIEWKSLFPVEWLEVKYNDASGKKQTADVLTVLGKILEFYYTPIGFDHAIEIGRRSKDLIWVVFGYKYKIKVGKGEGWQPYYWKDAHKIWSYIWKPIILDMNGYLIVLDNQKKKGLARIMSKEEFVERISELKLV